MFLTASRKQSRQATGWTYASGFAAALEGRLLSDAATGDLLASGGLDDLLGRVRQTLVFAELAETAEPFVLAERMEACYAAFVAQFAKGCPSGCVAELLLRAVEWRAFRAYLRGQVTESAAEGVGGSRVPQEVWERCWAGSAVAPEFARFAAAADAVRNALTPENRDPVVVDEHTLVGECRDLMALARETVSDAVADWVRTWLRLRLALALRRGRLSGWSHAAARDALLELGAAKADVAALEGEEAQGWTAALARLGLRDPAGAVAAGTPATVERLIDDAMTELVRGARGIPFGPEPVFAFLWGARTEALNLRLTATGVAAGLARDAIAEDVRRSYV